MLLLVLKKKSPTGCIGAVLVLFSLSTVCIIIHESLSLQQKSFRKKVDHLNDFIRRKRIPDPLAARVCMRTINQNLPLCWHVHVSSTKTWLNWFDSCYQEGFPNTRRSFCITMSISATGTRPLEFWATIHPSVHPTTYIIITLQGPFLLGTRWFGHAAGTSWELEGWCDLHSEYLSCMFGNNFFMDFLHETEIVLYRADAPKVDARGILERYITRPCCFRVSRVGSQTCLAVWNFDGTSCLI